MNEYSVLCNMYYEGNVSHDNMGTFKTRDYIIEIQREEIKKEFLDIQYCYRCIMIFKDLLGREILRLNFNEAQASIFVDNISTFIYNDYSQLVVLSNILGSTVFESYNISLESTEDENQDFCILMKVMCYNSVTQTLRPVLTTVFPLADMDKLCNMMFFIYLIDLASNREGIYRV